MTQSALNAPHEDGEALYTPAQLLKRSRLPRDFVYTALKSGELTAYNAGRQSRPRYYVRWADFKAWLETLRVTVKE
ncbi:helix-turn-helix domain-containing protein [Deinococcus knuensis]|uniref:Helix-turn-helix domain-containing protein n=1 Tax=Deinococcus knuensis TaxID=1837380 RepID=A0ABQ2SD60_9DEIO|nr:helix-turn-helix domain-containing protein [Deinococcus knuensis]GGS14579.1 hypothetical protein GCM10008961_02300 [Deinococcus knuensis]